MLPVLILPFSDPKRCCSCNRVQRGCSGANIVGLRDCQGFVKVGVHEPVLFIDVHTGWNKILKKYDHSEQAKALLDAINAWPTTK